MKRIRFLLLTVLMLSWGTGWAQTKSVSGVVLSADTQEPIIGASVMLKGTTVGTITDPDGHFILSNIPTQAKQIEVSYLGMVSQTLALKSTPYKILLQEDAQLLGEVIVQGAYGAQTKASVTGAISSVGADKIEQRPISSAASVLEGSTSGVQVNSSYGEPGASATIRIRGFGSVNGSNAPLYVLDGVPYQGNVSDINPNDIESISVLKDAASAALYGNKAANGVIIITTKKGKGSALSFNLSMNQGVYERGISEYDRLNARDWMETMWEGYRNGQITDGRDPSIANSLATDNLVKEIVKYNIFNAADDKLFDENGKMLANVQMLPGYKGDMDWYKPIERYGHRQEYNMNGGGATEKANYYFSVGYLDEKGYIKSSDFQRLSGRTNINLNVTDWFKTGFNLSGTHQVKNLTSGDADSSNSFANPFMFARNMAPVYPIHEHDADTGDYILDDNGKKIYDDGYIRQRPQNSGRHIVWETELNKRRQYRNTLNAQLFADFKFLKDFTFTLRGSVNLTNLEEKTYNNAIIGDGKGQGRARRDVVRSKEYTFQQQLDWNKLIADKHHLNILLGHENFKDSYNTLYGYKTDQIFEDNDAMINFTQITSLYDYFNDYRVESYLSRVRYNYDEKYFGEFSFRRDGSSKFHKDNRWGNFWSVGGSWMISNEEFMQPYKDQVNDLKLRISYGEVGNDASVGRYGYKELYSLSQNNNLGAAYKTQMKNEKLKWETTQSFGVALEGRFWNRLNATVEYFDKRSKDLLFDVNLPLSVGGTSVSNLQSVVTRNIGTVSNRGFEINADMDVIKNKDWTWNIGMNGTYIKNKIIKLPEENREHGIVSGTKKYTEGRGIYDFWMYKYAGVDQLTGIALYHIDSDKYYVDPANAAKGKKEAQGGVIINGKEYVTKTTYARKGWSGSAMPKWYGSLNTSLQWKDLTLTVLFTYSLGNKIIDYNYSGMMNVTANPGAIHKDIKKAWSQAPEGMQENDPNRIDPNGIPRIDYSTANDANSTSDRFLQKGDYLTIKNITLSYSFPKKLTEQLKLTKIGVNMSLENLYTFTSKKGMTPTQSFSGTNYNAFVPARVLSFGLNVKF